MKLKVFYEKIYDKVFSVPFFQKFLKIPFIKKLLDYEVVSYLVFGVLTTVVNFLTYWLVGLVSGEGYEERVLFTIGSFEFKYLLLVNAIAWIAAVIFAFITNKLFVFESTSWNGKLVVKELISFVGARIVSFIVFEELIFSLMLNYLHINHYVVKIIVSVFVVIFNYVASKLVIFRKKGEEK